MKRIVSLFMVIVLAYLSYSTYIYSDLGESIATASYRWGSRGSTVIEIQRKLKNWGYYKGSVDGVYGYQTYRAVRYFQSKNGLRVDGVAGTATLNALGINTYTARTSLAYSSNRDLSVLSRTIHGEARGEPYVGMVAVGAVILNRTRDPRFPQSVAGVVYQPGAFTAVTDGQINLPPGDVAEKAARDSLNGWDPSGGAIYYYNPAKTTNKWIWSRPIIKVIGRHYFCK